MQKFRQAEGESWNIRWRGKSNVPRSLTNGLTKRYNGSPEAQARQFLKDYVWLFSMPKDLGSLKLERIRENRGVHHVTFQQYHKGMRVEDAQLKVRIESNGAIAMVNGFYYPNIELNNSFAMNEESAIQVVLSSMNQKLETNHNSVIEKIVYPNNDTTFSAAYHVITKFPKGTENFRYVISATNGTVLSKKSQLSHVTGYGQAYPTHPGLGGTATRLIFRLSGNGYLDGTYVKTNNNTASNAYSSSNYFWFNTSSAKFDEYNVYYHVDKFRNDFVNNLIPTDSIFTQIVANVRASHPTEGPDAAWFDGGDSTINFGAGASWKGSNNYSWEDKIIYHEYVHAIIFDIEPGIESLDGFEEGAISEGVPDYFAASYTNRAKILDYAKPDIQRDITSPLASTYSEYLNLELNAHDGSEFFSSILWSIRNDAAMSSASHMDQLVMDALQDIGSSPDFIDFRDALMTADQSDCGGNHKELIQNRFADVGVGQHVIPTLSGSAPSGSPYLHWNATGGTASYKINRFSDHPDVSNAEFTTTNTYFSDNLAIFVELGSTFFDGVFYSVQAISPSGMISYPSNVITYREMGGFGFKEILSEDIPHRIPDDFEVGQNFPNPFNPSTQLRFGVPKNAEVSVRFVSIDGRLISTSIRNYEAGYHSIPFDGSQLSSGLYIAQFQFKSEDGTVLIKSLKMNLLK